MTEITKTSILLDLNFSINIFL